MSGFFRRTFRFASLPKMISVQFSSVAQEAGQVIWYSHPFQNFPQFIVIHTVKGFGIDNKADIDEGDRDAGELCGGASRVPSTVSTSNS